MENQDLQNGIVAPVSGALIEPELFPSGEVNEAGTIASAGKSAGLSEVVDAGPDEFADDIVMIAHAKPVVDGRTSLGAQAQAVGEARSLRNVGVGAVKAVDIIVAGKVQGIHEAVSRGNIGLVASGGSRTGGVLFVADGDQLTRHFRAVRFKLIGNLVADAVEDNAGVVAVAAQHGAQVGVVPLLEIKMVAVLRLAAGVLGESVRPVTGPFIEGLIEDVKPKLIAQVVKLRGEGMMAGANSVAAHLLEAGQAHGPDGGRHGVAEGAGVLVQADALEFDGLAVDE